MEKRGVEVEVKKVMAMVFIPIRLVVEADAMAMEPVDVGMGMDAVVGESPMVMLIDIRGCWLVSVGAWSLQSWWYKTTVCFYPKDRSKKLPIIYLDESNAQPSDLYLFPGEQVGVQHGDPVPALA
jgi:hypothetical protein